MAEPRISVVMPVYNRAWIVADAIESVIALDRADLELIVVDDGSNDGTGEILASFAGRHGDQVKVCTHVGCVNRGIAASRNLGVARSSGRYVAFLDSDDLYLPNRFDRAIDWLWNHAS